MAETQEVKEETVEHNGFLEIVHRNIINTLETNGLELRDHQKVGISQILQWRKRGHGGILGDEMGLGKTAQAAIVLWQLFHEGGGPFLIVCPYTVVQHFSQEIMRFTCGQIAPVTHYGTMSERHDFFHSRNKRLQRNEALIVPYTLVNADIANLRSVHRHTPFTALVLDEAQKGKNRGTGLYSALRSLDIWKLLMTGTAVQKDLGDLHALLALCDPTEFPTRLQPAFQRKYEYRNNADEFKEILQKYTVRRTKKEIMRDEMPPYEEIVLHHGLSEKQKELYVMHLHRDYAGLSKVFKYRVFGINNLSMDLRKLVFHPYFFRGVEPVPFTEGEHLVNASGKLQMLDRLLKYLSEKGHRCLLFSQFGMSLDITEDYLTMRGYTFERIDGKVAMNDRFTAIQKFHEAGQAGPFVFLLTSQSGGVGLNLTGADTVVFLDSDWNPQNDQQAMARCHRIGQTKPVRVIRLVARHTVEEYMLLKARMKLRFTEDMVAEYEQSLSNGALHDTLKLGVHGMQQDTDTNGVGMTDEDLEKIIGSTDKNGFWLPREETDEDGKDEQVEQDLNMNDNPRPRRAGIVRALPDDDDNDEEEDHEDDVDLQNREVPVIPRKRTRLN